MPDPTPAQAVLTVKDFALPALTIVASFAGAWIASKLALSNYYRQQIWERKADAYTSIFEAICTVERWPSKHWDASQTGKEIEEDRKLTLHKEANKAEEELERRLGC